MSMWIPILRFSDARIATLRPNSRWRLIPWSPGILHIFVAQRYHSENYCGTYINCGSLLQGACFGMLQHFCWHVTSLQMGLWHRKSWANYRLNVWISKAQSWSACLFSSGCISIRFEWHITMHHMDMAGWPVILIPKPALSTPDLGLECSQSVQSVKRVVPSVTNFSMLGMLHRLPRFHHAFHRLPPQQAQIRQLNPPF